MSNQPQLTQRERAALATAQNGWHTQAKLGINRASATKLCRCGLLKKRFIPGKRYAPDACCQYHATQH
ncbi:hypothetical protein [Gilvimarinus agarilyticus]|uniref:hypothetical protein n=1 Tax=Gilvimarinus agarilyticus TaxID=679259 RepID=UPI0005A0C103|nr:hypothetical protein [Gilvimarinus agarilyticus]